MADDPKKDDPKGDPAKDDPPKDDPAKDPKMDTDEGKRALAAERKSAREAKARADALEAELNELKDKDKTELEKLRDQVTDLTGKLAASDSKSLRADVAMAKGLTPAQAKRLVGTTQEELEADADEILEAFPAADGSKPPPSRRPAADLKGGGDPTQDAEDLDPVKLAENIPRP